jgi:hypothetical protein
MRYYFTHDGEEVLGPFEINELKKLHITSATPIWYEGLADWTTAGEVSALLPILTFGRGGPPPIQTHGEEPLLPNQYAGYKSPKTKGNGVFWLVLIGLFLLLGGGFFWFINNKAQDTPFGIGINKTQEELDREFVASQELEEKRLKEKAIFLKKQKHRKNWKRYIKVDASFDQMNFLGGLENVKVRVRNNSEYMLDKVQVRVQYILKDGDVWDTEILILSGIEAKSSKEMNAPESFRGKTLDLTITSIKSEEMNFCYPKGGGDAAADDPYYCR